jgi:hypothetical protein
MSKSIKDMWLQSPVHIKEKEEIIRSNMTLEEKLDEDWFNTNAYKIEALIKHKVLNADKEQKNSVILSNMQLAVGSGAYIGVNPKFIKKVAEDCGLVCINDVELEFSF